VIERRDERGQFALQSWKSSGFIATKMRSPVTQRQRFGRKIPATRRPFMPSLTTTLGHRRGLLQITIEGDLRIRHGQGTFNARRKRSRLHCAKHASGLPQIRHVKALSE
jgi:hypothetical protein